MAEDKTSPLGNIWGEGGREKEEGGWKALTRGSEDVFLEVLVYERRGGEAEAKTRHLEIIRGGGGGGRRREKERWKAFRCGSGDVFLKVLV